MSSTPWRDLGARIERRLIRTAEVAVILILDAAVVLFVWALIFGVEKLTPGENEFFNVVKDLSHGSILLLYLAWIIWDVWEFLKQD